MSDFTVYWSVRSRRLAIIKIWFKTCLLTCVLLCSKMLLCYRHTVKKINHFYDLIMMIYNIQTFYLMFIFYRIYWCSMWARFKSNCGPINFEKLGANMAPKVSIVNHNPVLTARIVFMLFIYFGQVIDHKSKVSLCKPLVCWITAYIIVYKSLTPVVQS